MIVEQPGYALEGSRFAISLYDRMPAFSSFLPGIAGVQGIPLWVYYCNRGQGVHSAGVHHKGNAIMEFNPANTAFENVTLKGFRTFVRIDGKFYEPFSPLSNAQRTMRIDRNRLNISEINAELGIKTTVTYFVLPNEPIGALVRRVEITGLLPGPVSLEVLDGLPKVIPYGLQLGTFKEMSNLMKSWADVRGMEHDYALYSMRSSTDDASEVKEVAGGYFYLTLLNGVRRQVVFDPDTVFWQELSLQLPRIFMENGLAGVNALEQCFCNKIPCGFTPVQSELGAGKSLCFDSLLGFAGSDSLLQEMLPRFAMPGYFEQKEKEARELVESFTKDVWTQSGSPMFDQYLRQSYLDNFLRGGYPLVVSGRSGKKVIHLFSRKHGDPERDYNFFTTAGEFYSQGNGNFRDVCQNRRHDVALHPQVGDFNVWSFLSLIQIDGYNPLEIRPASFEIPQKHKVQQNVLLQQHLPVQHSGFSALLEKPFTPGQLCSFLADHRLKVTGNTEDLINGLLALSEQRIEAGFGEGYWSDHFDYCLDLIEDYLSIYPDRQQELFFERMDYRFYDSAAYIRPRKDTQVITQKGLRHYGALCHDTQKAESPGFLPQGTNWLKDFSGKLVQTNLYGKLLTLVANKVALLDPSGLGIEMDGGKPGWCDAMNGLPGLMGSGMPETIELRRLLQKMLLVCPKEGSLSLPEEIADLLLGLSAIAEMDAFESWQQKADLREAFREKVRKGVSGVSKALPYAALSVILEGFHEIVHQGIRKALELGEGIMPTYFTHDASSWEPQLNLDGSPRITPYGLPGAELKAAELMPVPFFLEGPARMLNAAYRDEQDAMKRMAHKVRQSGMYDAQLKMFKTSESLEALSMEYGRIRAFTPGWLERESIFLHMEYKYFLGLLKSGLYEEFFACIKDALIPFLQPEVYGRSILENSSFLASSVNPDPATHGRGFVARLTGSTVEVISMWLAMLMGQDLFVMEEDELCLCFQPILPDWLFDQKGELAFQLLSSCEVRYINPGFLPTFGEQAAKVVRLTCTMTDGQSMGISGSCLRGKMAEALRNGEIRLILAEIA